MERITKKAEAYNSAYNGATACDLLDVYERPSRAKIDAFRRCKNRMIEANGRGMRILSHSCHFFTIGYVYTDDKSGEIRLAVETGRNFYDFPRL